MDVAHWAFVVMAFGGTFVLRAPESLMFLAGIAVASLILRVTMKNSCIITEVANTTSLPNITGMQVTRLFAGLLFAVLCRLLLQLVFGRGFPLDQLLRAITGHEVG